MPLFVAIFSEPLSDEVMELAKSGPVEAMYRIDDHALVVRSYAENPQILSNHFGMTSDLPKLRSGVVFKLNGSYFGFHDPRLWDWLAGNRS